MIYSTKCESCRESSKNQVKLYRSRDENGKAYHSYMYECENENCDIKRTAKREVRKDSDLTLRMKTRNSKTGYKTQRKER